MSYQKLSEAEGTDAFVIDDSEIGLATLDEHGRDNGSPDTPASKSSESTSTSITGTLTYLQGFALIIGLQVGSGIFSSPNQVHIRAGSYGGSILVWIVSGVLAWSGAACYAELGSMIPENGGAKAYLQRMYGDYAAALYSWSMLAVLKPGSAAIIAIVLGEYITKDAIVKRIIAIGVVAATCLTNYFGYGASAGSVYLVMKGVLLLFVFILGIVVGPRRSHSEDAIWAGTHGIPDLLAAVYGGVWAYDGWDNLNFVTSEMRNPTRDLPRIIATAMPTVIIAYCVVNVAYFAALSGAELDAAPSVVLTIANKTGSTALVAAVSGGIAMSCAGALNAQMFSMAKLTQISAAEAYLPRLFASLPWALAFMTVSTAVYIGAGEFHSLVSFYGAVVYIWYLVTIVGLLILRWREPDLKRPYRTWLIAPVTFIAFAAVLIVNTTIKSPLMMLAVAAFLLVAAGVHAVQKKLQARAAAASGANGLR